MPLIGDYEPSPYQPSRDQVELYERSEGTEGNTLGGAPVIVLTSVGVKTGKLRKTPLIRVEHNGEYAVVASMGGAPMNPAWYHNVSANPEVELQDGAAKGAYIAREVLGEERTLWLQRAEKVWPAYAEYQQQTDRVIPVFVLSANSVG
ncbi:nitroreductase family deazaflavin-dependent oxidoreductase [Nocardia aobensis]|uniref:Nitroreductase family deazaflavin-dependent oxidoreductase n=1 Tax=Nocardia aobensis TaxID=257277 RepID=A0ABW6PEV0_9NOCA|nr:nitroreductase family deazaflavin-dependent oxidoreductase [Nocardia elegans]MBF6451187.1 nitroreductase family deazaflavin-dependent oxidoreductase [Nocardia elegans]